MIEDKSFNAFLKGRLEEGVAVPVVSPVASRWRPLLMAASLAVISGAFIWRISDARDASEERYVARTIEFLEECQCISANSGSAVLSGQSDTFADRILAWQDAPFREIEY